MYSDTAERTRTMEERERLRTRRQNESVMLFVTLASIGDAVITTTADAYVDFLNPMAEELTGWCLHDAVGVKIDQVLNLVDENTGEAIDNPAVQAIASASKVDLPANTVLVSRDGRKIPIDDSAAPILGSKNETLGAVIVFRDITERKRAESAIHYRSELDRIAARISTTFITSPVSEVDAKIDMALKELGEFITADRAYVFQFGYPLKTMTCTHEWNKLNSNLVAGSTLSMDDFPLWVDSLMNGKHVRVSHLEEIPPDSTPERTLWSKAGMKTLVAVPMLQEDRVLGYVAVDSLSEARIWPEEIVNTLHLLGNIFASAIGRRDAQRKLDAARDRELEIGASIQESLLLSNPPVDSSDYQIAALTTPSRGIDGDFYDFLLHPNRSLDVIFGDVMGKGLPAALLSAGAKTEFLRSLSHLVVSSFRGMLPQPEDIVNSVHSVLTPQLLNLDSFVTLTYARFNPRDKQITIVDCGNTQLIRCNDKGEVEYLVGDNVPLGFSLAEVYTESVYDYAAGDLFVLYSDGVTEARNASGEMFGSDRLQKLIADRRSLPAQLISQSIREAVIDFVGSSALADDLTCVVIRVAPGFATDDLGSVEMLQVTSSLGDLGVIRAFIRGFCERRQFCGLEEDELNLLELAVNEVASNIMRHAYRGRADQRIWVQIEKIPKTVKVRLLHTGEPFGHSGDIPEPKLGETKEGGYGLFIIDRTVDRIDYGQSSDGKQFIEIVKRCKV